jgi:hypothetical protein
MIKKLLIMTAGLLGGFASEAYAVIGSYSAGATFRTRLEISSVVNADFGKLSAGVATTVYKMDTSGDVTVASGPGVQLSETGSQAASMLIKGSAFQSIDISVGSYTANNSVTPSAATCRYNMGAEAACTATVFDTAAAPTSAGKTLQLGLTISAAANRTEGLVAAPTFVVTVAYN